ncbi:hypothetical protein MNBD_GAMMA09-3167 [hydrothermal vent metagenome]|uniref:Uncharacterized protein n=1 Tax=hydrothermal vent metagenome TaxID=652676 RepID=A0A3B0YJN6_9ZZZZ
MHPVRLSSQFIVKRFYGCFLLMGIITLEKSAESQKSVQVLDPKLIS